MVPRRLAVMSVILVLGATLLLGVLLKAPCTSGPWDDGRPYTRFCYSDVVPLFDLRGLSAGDVPYFEAPNEYPVLSGALMYLTSLPARSDGAYFFTNAIVLSGLAALVTFVLLRLSGDRALFFAAAPSLALTGLLNWDLLPIALVALAVAAFLGRRDAVAGALLGLGAAAKVFPGFLLIPFALQRVREGESRRATRLVGAGIAAWMAVNLPVASASFDEWSRFLSFNAERPVDWGTLWFVGCHVATRELACPAVGAVNVLSWVSFVALAVAMYRWKATRDPGFARWTFCFPMLVALLLTSKVYSPQYTLWLLPWFALVLPDVRVFAAVMATDVAVFFTEFSWLGREAGFGGLPVWTMEVAVVTRAAALVWCLVAYIRASSHAFEPVGVSVELPTLTPSMT